MKTKPKERQITDEILFTFASYMEEVDAASMEAYLDTDKRCKPAAQTPKQLLKSSGLTKRILRYAAAILLVLAVGIIAIPTTEAHAWFIWKLELLFGSQSDHVDVRPDDEQQFPQFYVSEVPEGFDVVASQETEGDVYIQYENENGSYISFFQMVRESFEMEIDNEHRTNSEEVIGEFKVQISRGKEDYIFVLTTDVVAIVIQTNTDYETGKSFIENLKKF